MKVFFDTEFTGLHQNTTLISIGLVAEDGRTFYAELSDYDPEQVDDWIRDNVLAHCAWNQGETYPEFPTYQDEHWRIYGHKSKVAAALTRWLAWYADVDETVEMWSDCYAYDWMLFCQLWGHAFNIPDWVYYIPFDLSTAFKLKGIDPDIDREEYAHIQFESARPGLMSKHNALWDARVIYSCYQKLMENQ